ncbi:hypothetical protein BU26DRAFT_117732 [Trematosphaeria pertusa]|uniref:Uncharacterized protein n=1 Tax=Trematosphaeria pertusa TaxID=390896 RepID=A0A6A6I0A3_9PLEO|nr:uncharacterized protein BU26DRAFT_117732 [Trematosphaeria pertusa]KAF2243438.1 hypothetical protein BU26DRAFT_117732 [Trematosphaeria pertusa]
MPCVSCSFGPFGGIALQPPASTDRPVLACRPCFFISEWKHMCPRSRTTFPSLSCRSTIKITSDIIGIIFWKVLPYIKRPRSKDNRRNHQQGHGPVCDPPALNTSNFAQQLHGLRLISLGGGLFVLSCWLYSKHFILSYCFILLVAIPHSARSSLTGSPLRQQSSLPASNQRPIFDTIRKSGSKCRKKLVQIHPCHRIGQKGRRYRNWIRSTLTITCFLWNVAHRGCL